MSVFVDNLCRHLMKLPQRAGFSPLKSKALMTRDFWSEIWNASSLLVSPDDPGQLKPKVCFPLNWPDPEGRCERQLWGHEE